MADIFISHSSADKTIAKKLAEDLTSSGHVPWLDEWEIKVGECIPSKIEQGLRDSEYVVVLLSKNSTSSAWVSREWKAKYWDEIEKGRIMVLPVLLQDCERPELLKTKKYADFRTNYTLGFVDLMAAISPTIASREPSAFPVAPALDREIEALLSRVQARTEPLSQHITEALTIARRIGDIRMERFCRNELEGWTKEKLEESKEDKPHWRFISGYLGIGREINLQYFGWGESVGRVFDYMRNDPESFRPWKMVLPDPLSKLIGLRRAPEEAHKSILTLTFSSKQLAPGMKDFPVPFYARTDSIMDEPVARKGSLTNQHKGYILYIYK